LQGFFSRLVTASAGMPRKGVKPLNAPAEHGGGTTPVAAVVHGEPAPLPGSSDCLDRAAVHVEQPPARLVAWQRLNNGTHDTPAKKVDEAWLGIAVWHQSHWHS